MEGESQTESLLGLPCNIKGPGFPVCAYLDSRLNSAISTFLSNGFVCYYCGIRLDLSYLPFSLFSLSQVKDSILLYNHYFFSPIFRFVGNACWLFCISIYVKVMKKFFKI